MLSSNEDDTDFFPLFFFCFTLMVLLVCVYNNYSNVTIIVKVLYLLMVFAGGVASSDNTIYLFMRSTS